MFDPTEKQIKQIENIMDMKHRGNSVFYKPIDEDTEYVLYAGLINYLHIQNKKTGSWRTVKLTKYQIYALERVWGVFL